jgi:hypothetical protein
MAQIPHFAIPFRFEAGAAAVNEQDSSSDVATCVEVVLRYRRGTRLSAPDFGIDDPTFSQAPFNGAGLIAAIEEQEPRARAALYDVEDDLGRAAALADGVDIVRIALGVSS